MKKREILFLLVLGAITLGVYSKTLNYELVWDDKVFFKDNLLFLENKPLSSAFTYGYFRQQIGISNVDFYYRPLLTLSFMLEHKLWGLNYASLRLVNLFIYLLALLIFYLFFKSQSAQNNFAEIVTLIFALFPLNLENIVWIVGRGDLLLLLWGSLTFLFLDFFSKKHKPLYLVCSSLFFLLGVFSKESFMFLFPILVLFEITKRKKLSWPYHSANFLIILFYFVLKNGVLHIKNLGFTFSPDIIGQMQAALASLGYYLRSILFPIRYDMFLATEQIVNPFYLLLGIACLALLAYLIYRSTKDQELILPLSLILIFLAGHVLLIFTSLFPYKIYARYMMIPALGFIWIFVKYLGLVKEKVKLYVIAILILAFVPSIIMNSNVYRSEVSFWKKGTLSSPKDGYALFKLAETLFQKKDNLSAELALNKILSLPIKRETALLVSLLYADIEFLRADYQNVLKWISSVEAFENMPQIQIVPFMKFYIKNKKALLNICLGNADSAEKLLKENILNYPAMKEPYRELYNIYTTHDMWDKAEALEKSMKKQFPSSFVSFNTKEIEKTLESATPDQKIAFYLQNRNYQKAIELLLALKSFDIDHNILLVKLYYLSGQPEEAERIGKELYNQNLDSFQILNKIGQMYLFDLLRVKEALVFFKRSLEFNKNQPELFYLVNQLTQGYLSQLKDVWKKG